MKDFQATARAAKLRRQASARAKARARTPEATVRICGSCGGSGDLRPPFAGAQCPRCSGSGRDPLSTNM